VNLLVALALLIAQPKAATAEQPPAVEASPAMADAPELNNPLYVNVVLRLHADPELRAGHEGYWAALKARPAWMEQEVLWWQLMQTPDLGPLLVRVDEALQTDPGSEALYDAFYARLAADETLRRAVEQFERAGQVRRGDVRQWQAALDYLRMNPTSALSILDGLESGEALPAPLQPYARELLNLREWQPLRDALRAMVEHAATAETLSPWWSQVATLDSRHEGLFSSLALHFARSPQRFWAVYRRELALAEDPALRDWVRWWHRRIRRADLRYNDYLAYLGALRDGRENAPKGDAEWPPANEPPALQPLEEKLLPKVMPRRERVDSVVRPQVEPPARPERPERPAMRESERLQQRLREVKQKNAAP
jgi:hypothetical protein